MAPQKVKVAVIGSGLAGLTAAHLLNKKSVEFDVHLFEKSPVIGMDSASMSVPTSHPTEKWRIDVPMRSFQGGYYEHLIAFYKDLGVQLQQANFSYSFSSLLFAKEVQQRSITTTFIYNGASGRSGLGRPSCYDPDDKDLISQIKCFALFLISSLYTILCFLYSLWHSVPVWRDDAIPNVVLRDWAVQVTPTSLFARILGLNTAWNHYVETVLVPTFSAVCTSSAEDVWNHPVEELLDYIWLTFGTHHYVVVGGVRTVVRHLTANLQHIHLASAIQTLKPDPVNKGCLTIVREVDGVLEEHGGFHHIIFATQASAAARLLATYHASLPEASPVRDEKLQPLINCLETFESRQSIVINHTDSTLLPDDARDVRELNLISALVPNRCALSTESSHPLCSSSTHTMATHIQRRHPLYSKNKPTLYQTTNPLIPPRKDSILSVGKLERAVVTKPSKKALSALCKIESRRWWQCPYQAKTCLGPLQGARVASEPNAPGIWFCGSYAHLGIPLLEGCISSAFNVVEQGILKK